MALILIAEFAEDTPGDDLKLITHNSKILDNGGLMPIIVSTYLGLFSSGGNNVSEKFGTIPLEQNKSSFAWSYLTKNSEKSRLLIVVVPSNEVDQISEKINTSEIKVRISQIKSIIIQEDINLDGLNRGIALLDSSLQEKDEVSRLSDVFGSEI